jgi:hypothetical protein
MDTPKGRDRAFRRHPARDSAPLGEKERLADTPSTYGFTFFVLYLLGIQLP